MSFFVARKTENDKSSQREKMETTEYVIVKAYKRKEDIYERQLHGDKKRTRGED